MKLGEVGTFCRGGNFSKNDFVENGFPCIHYGQIHMKFGTETFKHISSVPIEMVKRDRCAHKGDLVIAITSEDDEGSCKCTAWMGDYDVYVGGHTAIYRHTMQPKYVSYYFMSPRFQIDKLEYTHGFKVVEINPKDIAKITIPIPPLPEQQRIVSYLDAEFAKIEALKANAEKQLQAAKDLFQAALKELLTPKEGWVEKKFGDVCHYYKVQGKWENIEYIGLEHIEAHTSNLLATISANDVESSTFKFNKGDVLYGRLRPYLQKVVIAPFDGCCSTEIFPIKSNIINNAFLKYWLLSDRVTEIMINSCSGCRMPRANMNDFKQETIHYPQFEDQQQIANKLDAISAKVKSLQTNYTETITLCNDLKQALLKKVFE